MVLRHFHDQRSGPPHFFVQQSNRILLMIITSEGIGADEFSKPIRLVGISCHMGPHFVQHNGNTSVGNRPSCFAARHAATDNMNWFCHNGLLPRMAVLIK